MHIFCCVGLHKWGEKSEQSLGLFAPPAGYSRWRVTCLNCSMTRTKYKKIKKNKLRLFIG